MSSDSDAIRSTRVPNLKRSRRLVALWDSAGCLARRSNGPRIGSRIERGVNACHRRHAAARVRHSGSRASFTRRVDI